MFRFLFQAAFLCVVSPLCRHTTCPPPPPPPPPLLHPQLEYWAGICERCSRAECEGLGGVLRRRGRRRSERGGRWEEGEEEREKEGRGDYLGPSSAARHPHLLLLLPIMEPWGSREAALCLAAMQPLYHSNLLIVGAQLAHGGFLLEPPNIN